MAIFPAAACSLQSMNYCRVVTELIVFLNHTQKTKETKNWTKLFELNSPRYGAKQSASDSHVVFICKKIASRWLYGKVTRKIIGGDQAGRFEKHPISLYLISFLERPVNVPGFGESGGTPPQRIPGSTPPRFYGIHRLNSMTTQTVMTKHRTKWKLSSPICAGLSSLSRNSLVSTTM